MTISKKLRHETHLDHEMREYYQAKIKGFIKPFPQIGESSDEYVANYKMAELDSQGRHRSEWCYAPYDGRVKIK